MTAGFVAGPSDDTVVRGCSYKRQGRPDCKAPRDATRRKCVEGGHRDAPGATEGKARRAAVKHAYKQDVVISASQQVTDSRKANIRRFSRHRWEARLCTAGGVWVD